MSEKSKEVSELSFDFVGDEGLRSALVRDAHELTVASAGGAPKATVVLAGSIIETVLLDHLVSTDHQSRTGNDPTKFEFWKLIEACHDEGVISDRTVHLLHAVRDYRNLIHPGRSLRLKDHVTSTSATIALGIVGLVCAEISERPNRRFGMTAEQALTKVRHDPKIVDMLNHILSELRPSELDRLVVQTIPQAFVEDQEMRDEQETRDSVDELYRKAFERCSDAAKTTRLDSLCQAIQSDPEWKVRVLLSHTFVGWHLQYAPQAKQGIIVDRLLVETKGAHLPFPPMTYQYLLNVLPIDSALKFLSNLHHRNRRHLDGEWKGLSAVLLGLPSNVPLLNSEAAKKHHSELIAQLEKIAERPRSGREDSVEKDYVSWLQEITMGDIPF
jgi:hypothetical protein